MRTFFIGMILATNLSGAQVLRSSEFVWEEAEVIASATQNTRTLMLRLQQKASNYNISLNNQQIALAHDIFFGIQHHQETLKRLQSEGGPTVIWVDSPRGIGNTLLLRLIAEVINPEALFNQHFFMTKLNWGSENDASNIASLSQESKFVVLDNFSKFRLVSTPERVNFMPDLLRNFESDTVFVFIDSGKTADILTAKEKSLIDYYVDGSKMVGVLCRDALAVH